MIPRKRKPRKDAWQNNDLIVPIIALLFAIPLSIGLLALL